MKLRSPRQMNEFNFGIPAIFILHQNIFYCRHQNILFDMNETKATI